MFQVKVAFQDGRVSVIFVFLKTELSSLNVVLRVFRRKHDAE